MTMASTYRLSRSFKLMRRDTVVLCIPLNCHNDAFLSGALRTFPTLPELLSRDESLPAKGGGQSTPAMLATVRHPKRLCREYGRPPEWRIRRAKTISVFSNGQAATDTDRTKRTAPSSPS